MSHSGKRFDPQHAHKLEDPERCVWLPADAVLEKLALEPAMRVLDVGAGTGYLTIPIALRVGPRGRAVAVDVSAEMLALLRTKLSGHKGTSVELVEADAGRIPLAGDAFDRVLMAHVWHELEDTNAALSEARRLLRRDGRLAILDWRHDVERPPGPPLDHRIPAPAVVETLARSAWNVDAPMTIGRYAYLVTASPTR